MIEFQKVIQAQFDKMCASGKLFRSLLTGQQVWDIYINGFEKKHNPIFRDPESSMHNCNLCKNFIRRYGNIVSIDEVYNIITMFDVIAPEEFITVAKYISDSLKNAKVSEVFFETFNELNSLPYESCNKNNALFKLGIDKNVKRYTKEEAEKYGVVKPEEIKTFNHLHLKLPNQFVDMGGKSIEAIMADYRDAKNVFQRAMVEIPLDTLNLVKDLIIQGSLLDGQTHLYKIEQFIPLKKQYYEIENSKKDNWCWVNSYKLQFAKFKNELIGVLCTELAEGKELNEACQAWNKRVDPANYMKASAPITKKQIEEARKFVEENGYSESFDRRFANIDDIKASEIKHINVGDGNLKTVSIFDNVKSTSTRHKRSEFDGVEEVSIDKFIQDILPTCNSVEAFLSNKHDGNMVSITTANVKESKPIFKWTNNYSWTFNGNLAGKSMIKDAVQSRGGKTEGIVNIRLAFPNTISDYDLHVTEPNSHEIYYGNRRQMQPSSGMLDLDAQGADGHFPPEKRVENIIYASEERMTKGKYLVYVHNYRKNDNNFGFTIEIEIEGEITTFIHNSMIGYKDAVKVCYINHVGNEFEIIPILPVGESNSISKELYGLQTNEFHKVNLVCLSPNHWDENNVGNKYFFFMLQGCKNKTSIRSFHNENLISELAQHRKVLEVLGTTNMIEPAEKQLSGLGFNATVKDELIVKLTGSHKRVIKIKF
jgi:hypothetical protein